MPTELPVVGIGFSAGGLESAQKFLARLQPNPPCAFLLVTHRRSRSTAILCKLLQKSSAIPVSELSNETILKPGHLYVCPPGKTPGFQGQAVLLKDVPPAPKSPSALRPLPIDSFLAELSAHRGPASVALILSGSGNDGTRGAASVKAAGGIVLAQDPATAQFKGMPASVIRAGLADSVLAPDSLGHQLQNLLPGHGGTLETTQRALTQIFALLRSRTGHDFSAYKSSTIERRIQRRIQIHNCPDCHTYIALLEKQPEEIDQLMADLLIRVTRFFRDPDAFQALAKNVLPGLIRQRPMHHPFRIWVPGCATGEEVFSLATLFREALDTAGHLGSIKLFGTDLDASAIDKARLGRFQKKDAADIPASKLRRFFVASESDIRVRKEIRDLAIFSIQNVIKDPPFIRLDLISCRNLLIYLGPELQAQLLPVFHYALNPGGILMLGSSETIGRFSDLFEVVDRKWKIFRKKELPAHLKRLHKPAEPNQISAPVSHPPTTSRAPHTHRLNQHLEHLLLQRFCPASVLCTSEGGVLFIHGKTGTFLEPPAGQPRLNLLEMARPGLRIELAAALRRASEHGGEVERLCSEVRGPSGTTSVQFTVSKLEDQGPLDGMLLVTFRSVAKPLKSATQKSPRLSGLSAVETLERELLSTRESLQATIEELQTSNEEFKSANEELQSTNEELQSANEEMETSKEELQSLNEELTTVNAEVEAKALELSRANDDILNLFNSTQIATLFLDNQLLIKRYAEPARRIFRLIPSDVGRPLSDLTNQLEHPSLLDDCKAVLQSLRPKAAEVRTRDGHSFLMRIMPYRTADNAVDGVVATFVDIQPVKSTQSSSDLFRRAFQQHPLPMLILDSLGRIQAANTQSLDFLPAAAPDSTSLFEHHLAPGSVRRFRSALSKTVRSRSGTEMTVTIQSGMTRGSHCGLQLFALTSNNSGGASVCVLISRPHQTQNSNAPTPPPTRQ